MKVLVIGSGGREHALVWKISKSSLVDKVYCAPGNAGIAEIAETADLSASDIDGLADFAKREAIDLTVVGPEVPLTMGIVDHFEKEGLKIFGPSGAAAELEGSKAFSKAIMKKYGVPTAAYASFTSKKEALDYIDKMGAPIVIKADGLAAGKGVVVAQTLAEAGEAVEAMMGDKAFGAAGEKVVVEEFMDGEEASYLVFSDGKNILPMPTSQDHKAVYDGDKGPNTGGMGAYSPAPVVTEALEKRIIKEIIKPLIDGMAKEGKPYKGILYAGLMMTKDGPRVVEFNCRFGDPECQPIMMRMKSDIIPVLEAVVEEKLHTVTMEWEERKTVCIVMAAGGYPGNYEKGKEISGLNSFKDRQDLVVFHAGTSGREGKIVTNGGRVLGVTALGEGLEEAINLAYDAVKSISWEGVYFRKDIGKKGLARL
ncbi:MAG: phosphoribosylamine--glycine ligase [Deltaproteobacteria bacterium]|nr:phosphoribosylamine--glycine ligase [Deltaproteobacteria bacterium]